MEESDERPWEQPGVPRRDCEPHRGPLLKLCALVSMMISVLFFFATFCPVWGSLDRFVPKAVAWALVPAIFSLTNLPLAVVIWVLSARDLRRIHAGLVDPEGEVPTDYAKSAAITSVLFQVGGLVAYLFLALS